MFDDQYDHIQRFDDQVDHIQWFLLENPKNVWKITSIIGLKPPLSNEILHLIPFVEDRCDYGMTEKGPFLTAILTKVWLED